METIEIMKGLFMGVVIFTVVTVIGTLVYCILFPENNPDDDHLKWMDDEDT
jgi:hypothetical protein